MTMDIRHIRYFLAVAEAQNVTRAAEKLGIAQPPLSQQIKDLEHELGAPLFYRRSHGVELTEVGEAFLNEAKQVLVQVERAKHAAERAARGLTGQLRVGFSASAIFNPLVPSAIRSYTQAYPEVNLSLAEANTAGLYDQLRREMLDVAFLRPSTQELEGMEMHVLDEEPMFIALPQDHILKDYPTLDLAQIHDQPFIMFPRIVGYSLYDEVIHACRRAGFEPTVRQEVPQIASIITLVAAGLGISIVPRSMTQVHVEGVIYRAISGDAPIARLAIASRRHDRSLVVQRFLTLTQDLVSASPKSG